MYCFTTQPITKKTPREVLNYFKEDLQMSKPEQIRVHLSEIYYHIKEIRELTLTLEQKLKEQETRDEISNET